MQIEIRRLGGEEEARECARLMAGSEPWITLGRGFEESFAAITDTPMEVYVALTGGSIAGFIVIQMSGAFVGYIKAVAVRPELRGMGIGSALITFSEDRIFRSEPNVFITVSSFNERAERLYRRLGYSVVGELKEFIIPGHSEILLRKSIAPIAEFKNPKNG